MMDIDIFKIFPGIEKDQRIADLEASNENIRFILDEKMNQISGLLKICHNNPSFIDDVAAFHAGCGTIDPTAPTVPEDSKKALRWNLIDEEVNKELWPAMCNNDIPAIADAIADSIYVLVGTALCYGIPLAAVWREVQRANMAKFVDGKAVRREDGKILKPEGWTPPYISSVIAKHSA